MLVPCACACRDLCNLNCYANCIVAYDPSSIVISAEAPSGALTPLSRGIDVQLGLVAHQVVRFSCQRSLATIPKVRSDQQTCLLTSSAAALDLYSITPTFPLLSQLAGTPGDWLRSGRAAAVADCAGDPSAVAQSS